MSLRGTSPKWPQSTKEMSHRRSREVAATLVTECGSCGGMWLTPEGFLHACEHADQARAAEFAQAVVAVGWQIDRVLSSVPALQQVLRSGAAPPDLLLM